MVKKERSPEESRLQSAHTAIMAQIVVSVICRAVPIADMRIYYSIGAIALLLHGASVSETAR